MSERDEALLQARGYIEAALEVAENDLAQDGGPEATIIEHKDRQTLEALIEAWASGVPHSPELVRQIVHGATPEQARESMALFRAPGGFLVKWVESLHTGHTLTEDDVNRLRRVRLALIKGVEHHRQAREAGERARAVCTGCGATDWWLPDNGPTCNQCGGTEWRSEVAPAPDAPEARETPDADGYLRGPKPPCAQCGGTSWRMRHSDSGIGTCCGPIVLAEAREAGGLGFHCFGCDMYVPADQIDDDGRCLVCQEAARASAAAPAPTPSVSQAAEEVRAMVMDVNWWNANTAEDQVVRIGAIITRAAAPAGEMEALIEKAWTDGYLYHANNGSTEYVWNAWKKQRDRVMRWLAAVLAPGGTDG